MRCESESHLSTSKRTSTQQIQKHMRALSRSAIRSIVLAYRVQKRIRDHEENRRALTTMRIKR
jgi:magnesium-transporting ATPase (P-type)